jgi:hypothetical protein
MFSFFPRLQCVSDVRVLCVRCKYCCAVRRLTSDITSKSWLKNISKTAAAPKDGEVSINTVLHNNRLDF